MLPLVHSLRNQTLISRHLQLYLRGFPQIKTPEPVSQTPMNVFESNRKQIRLRITGNFRDNANFESNLTAYIQVVRYSV